MIILANIVMYVLALNSGMSMAFDYEVLSNWTLKRESSGIEFSYRDVRVGDSLTTREMRMTFAVDAVASQLIPYFRDPELFMDWSPDVDECELVDSKDSEWTLYKFYNLPWPIAERDIVTRYYLTSSDSLLHMKIAVVDGGVVPRQGVKRIDSYEAQWLLRPQSNGSTNIEFRTVQLTRTVGPRALQDRLIEKSFERSVALMRELVG